MARLAASAPPRVTRHAGQGGAGGTPHPTDAPFMVPLETWGVDGAIWHPNADLNDVTTPDDASLRITGDITLIWVGSLKNWGATGSTIPLGRGAGSAANRSYFIQFTAAGVPIIAWSTDGTAGGQLSATATAGLGATAYGSLVALMVTLDVDDGGGNRVAEFWTATDIAAALADLDGSAWTQLGATVTTAGTTSIFAGTAKVTVGHADNQTANDLFGATTHAQIISGLRGSGTVVADLDATDLAGWTASTYTDSTGKVWTVNRSGNATAERLTTSAWNWTEAEWLEFADRAGLNPGSGDMWAAAGFRTRTTATVDVLSKRDSDSPFPGWELQTDANLIRFTSSDGSDSVLSPSVTTINDGADHVAYGHVDRTTDVQVIDVDGTQEDTDSIAAVGDIGTADALVVGARGDGHTVKFAGQVYWFAVGVGGNLTAAQRAELGGWDGTVATEPSFLRDGSVTRLYATAADPTVQAHYLRDNTVLVMTDANQPRRLTATAPERF